MLMFEKGKSINFNHQLELIDIFKF